MIRKFTKEDMEQVLRIWVEASVKSHDFVNSDFWCSKIDDMRNIYIPSCETFVFEDEQMIIGFMSISENTLAALFVLPDMQGQGIGTQLLNFAKEMRSELKLSVYKVNILSVRFYEKNGFNIQKEQIDVHTGHPEFNMKWREQKI